MKAKIKHLPDKRRVGHHQVRTKKFHNVYLPYLPMVVILLASFFLSGYSPKRSSTLAYATEMSISGLLSATNNQRSSNGAGTLSISSSLNAAAQSKAQDMVSRNYWSHNTPDGNEPWIFFDAAGYSYSKAGENLAFGFGTSADTITGWMNSPPHRANLLDAGFIDVGFGIANSNDYTGTGQETVVVAMYGKPSAAVAATPPAAAPITPATTPRPTTPQQATPTPTTPAPVTSSDTPTPAAQSPVAASSEPETIVASKSPETTATLASTSARPQSIARIQILTKGAASWTLVAIGTMTGIAVLLMLFKHGLLLRHLIRDSERLVLHHPLFDTTVISLIILGATLLRTVGQVR